jgi:colanic acid/amylovoran biosynthesis glycosyltransferase
MADIRIDDPGRDTLPVTGGPRTATRVAFVVGVFPLVSETFIIDQIAYLRDRGAVVDVYSFNRGDDEFVSKRFFEYEMGSAVRYLDYPLSWPRRFLRAVPVALRLAARHPRVLLRALDVLRHGRSALSLKLLYWAAPLAGRDFDVVHCHFGTVAHDFVPVREVAGIDAPLVTTFYGVDVSKVFKEQGPKYYDALKQACSLYLVMSEDMKERVVAHGFPRERVEVLPVSIEVDRYPFHARTLCDGEELRLVAVGRLVEKKGFDDLLRALAIVGAQSTRPISCVIVGGGPLEDDLRRLSSQLGVEDAVDFRGFMTVEDVVRLFAEMHVLVQPSKTAANGDME